MRADGSSRFAKNNKWGWFPSLGFSWNVNEENFLKSAKWLEDLKFRASIGTVGNQEIGDYKFLSTYAGTHYFLGGVKNSAYYRSGLGNDDLKWETTTQFDLGLDLGFLKDRIRVVADYYNKVTSDLIFGITLPDTAQLTSVQSNDESSNKDPNGVIKSVIKDIYELQLLSELHYYLKTEHPFTPAETEALLAFKDPLNVARWCSEERGHSYSFPICELLDKIKAYDRFEQLPQEKTSLRERLQDAARIVKDRPAPDKPDRGGEAR